MLRRVVIAPRHYLRNPVALLACENSIQNFPSVPRSRWSTVLATHPQSTTSRRTRHHREVRVTKSVKGEGEPSFQSLSPSEVHQYPSPKQLATMISDFFERHGQTTESALRYLQSGPSCYSHIHRVLQTQKDVRHVTNYFARSKEPIKCVRLLSLAIAYGLPLRAPTYESVCWSLARAKKWSILLEVYRLARGGLDSPGVRLLNWRLRAICELENFAALEGVLQDYENAGVTPTRLTWRLILAGHLRNCNITAARKCLRSMEEAGFALDPSTHATIASYYRYFGLDSRVRELALSALGSLPPTTSVTVINQLLKSHIDSNDELGFYQLFSLFNKDAIAPIRPLLGPLGDIGDEELPVLSAPFPLSPTTTTFLLAARFCVTRSRFSSAEKVFLLLKQQGVDCTPNILGAYIDLQFSAGRAEFAIFVAAQMLSREKLGDLFDRLVHQGQAQFDGEWPFTDFHTTPHIGIFNALLRGVLGSCGLEAAHVVLQLMRRTSIEPDSRTLEILLSHLLRVERASLSVVLRMLRQISLTFRPTLRHIHLLISQALHDEKRRLHSAGSSGGKVDQSNGHSRHQGGHDGASSFSGLLGGIDLERYLKRSNLARSMIRSLASRNFQSDPCLMEMRIRHDAVIKHDVTAAINTYSTMLSRGIAPSEYHIAALMDGFVQQGEMDTALQIMESSKRHNIQPNVILYTILLYGYARQRQPRTAIQLFQTMVASGIQPDVRAIHAVCLSLFNARQPALARKLLIPLWAYIQPFPQEYADLPLRELLRLFCDLDASSSLSRRGTTLKQRLRLHHELTKIAIEYKRCSGLRRALLSNSRKIKKAAKARLHPNRKR